MYFYLEWDYSTVVNGKLDLILNLPKLQLCIANMGRKFALSRRVKNFERKTQALKKRPPHRPRKCCQQQGIRIDIIDYVVYNIYGIRNSQPVHPQTMVSSDLQVTIRI